MSDLTNFVSESSTFFGFVFSGCYTMPTDIFVQAFEHYKETGTNPLDEYSRIVYLGWESDSSDLLPKEDISFLRTALDKDNYWNIYYVLNEKQIAGLRHRILYSIRKWEKIESYDNRRLQASLYTSRSDIRIKIYKKHGKQCLSCGSSENIELDHIIPVCGGGENEIDNLQPLCKSCNIEKGTEIIDYRK